MSRSPAPVKANPRGTFRVTLGLGDLRGQRVGLFGGSFDPAHRGHLAVAEAARAACGLDRVIWLASPGNPLKAPGSAAPLAVRMAQARALTRGRAWITVSDAEARLGTRYTADTLAALRARLPSSRLVWIMGADSLAGFHRWRDWRGIASAMPLLIASRPGEAQAALTSPAARTLWRHRLPPAAARRLPACPPPAWCFLPGVAEAVSSTALRAARGDGTASPPEA